MKPDPDFVEIPRPDDLHVHFRTGPMLKAVIGHTARVFGRALAMPNLPDPVATASLVDAYRREILEATKGTGFQPLMSIYLFEHTAPLTVADAFRAGAVAAKLYPRGSTTLSDSGVRLYKLESLYPVFEEMASLGMVLCLHGENPDLPDMADRELGFLPFLLKLSAAFPRLRMVLEHVSSRDGVSAVKACPNVWGTITAHHLVLTADDVPKSPHNMCMPVAKSAADRQALIEAALRHGKFFFGSDSAPHPVLLKSTKKPPPTGVYSAPVALPLLAKVFHEHESLDSLADFTSRRGREAYGLPAPKDTVRLIPGRPSIEIGIMDDDPSPTAVQPFMAGRIIMWKVAT